MKEQFTRMLSGLLCLALLMSGAPAVSEEAAPVSTVEAAQPVETEPPAEAGQSAESEQATGTAQPTGAVQPSASVQPTDTAQPAASDAPEATAQADAPGDELQAQLNEAVGQWIAALDAQGLSTQYDRALWLYDCLIANVAPGEGASAHDALVLGRADSTGYALALAELLRAAGMDCRALTGDSGCWNLACIEGEWTHIDAYMDDVNASAGRHFGLSDGAMARDHGWNRAEALACGGANANYFVRSLGYQPYSDAEQLHALLAAAVAAQRTEIKLYNAGEAALSESLSALLAELAPASATAQEDGFLAAVSITYAAPEATEAANDAATATPDAAPTIAPAETAEAPVEAADLALFSAAEVAPASAPLPETIVPAAESLTLGLKEKVSLAGWTMLPEGAQDSVSYSSKSTRIASVNAEGVVTAKKTGSTTITIKAASGASCTVKITVKKAPTSVKIVAGRSELGVGETMQLTYKLSSGSSGAVSFSGNNDAVATVSVDGLVTALAPGEVKVTATSFNGKKKSMTLRVATAPTQVIPSLAEVSIGAQDAWTLGYSLDAGAAGAVSFASSNPAIATVDGEGRISALQQGEADIIITAYNGVSGVCHVKVTPAPTSITLSAERTTIGLKEKLTLIPEIEPAGTVGTLKFKSSKSSVASVNSSGVVTAKKTGTATITVSTYNGLSAKLKITVKKAPTSVKIVAERDVLGVGETLQLSYKLSSGSSGAVSFSGNNDAVATVSADGLVTALAPGEVKVTATSFNGKKKSMTLRVAAAPTQVTPSLTEVSIGAQDAWTLGYSLDAGAAGAVSFASSNPAIATVDGEGRISALQQGEADIIITAYNGVSGVCHVKVTPAPTSITLSAERTTIGLKEKLTLIPEIEPAGTVGTLKFKSSKSSVASVNSSGVVTAKKTGTATITVSTYNGLSAKLKITVKKAPTSVKIVAERDVLGVGETMQLTYKLSSGSAGAVSFSGNNDAVATVSPDGLVTALAPGEVKVTATSFNGKKKSVTLRVASAPTQVIPSLAEVSIGAQDAWTLGYSLDAGAAGAVSFASSNPAIATVDGEGRISALQQGEADIIITAYNGVSGVCHVKVTPAPTSITLSAERTTIGLKEKLTLIPEIEPAGTLGTLKFKSSKSSVASVNASGVVTAKKTGTATITVSTYNGLSAKLKITVKKAPTSVKIVAGRDVLGVGETLTLSCKLSSGSAGAVSFASNNPNVLAVNAYGELSALSTGTATITATSFNGKSGRKTFEVREAPASISLSFSDTMAVGMKEAPQIALLPQGSYAEVSLSVVSGDAVEIDSKGRVCAVRAGRAVVRAATQLPGVYAERSVLVLPAPSFVSFDQENYSVNVDGTLRLSPTLSSGSYAILSYEIRKEGYFTIDEDGLVTPIRRGSSQVTVRTQNGLSATTTVWVVDPYYPESIELSGTVPEYLEPGDVYTPTLSVFPDTAQAGMQWSSSDSEIASVNASSGKVTAHSSGRVVISGTSSRNPSLSVSYKLVVLSTERCLKMPNRRTDTGEISETKAQIREVRASAYLELEAAYARGDISKSEYNTRHGYIERAFDMYLMPWMTPTKVLYWKAANSENGAKDFKPGIVYHGMPYTQTNRVNSKSSAVKNGYYSDTGKGYYKFNSSKFSSRNYPGSDCSSFVSMAIWGDSSGRRSDNTRAIGSASYYRTLSGSAWSDLRPGDLLNKSGSHVVMFLYYANESRDQIVIIEQGGGEAGTNTVSCSIRDVSYYTSRNYKIRRVSSLAY